MLKPCKTTSVKEPGLCVLRTLMEIFLTLSCRFMQKPSQERRRNTSGFGYQWSFDGRAQLVRLPTLFCVFALFVRRFAVNALQAWSRINQFHSIKLTTIIDWYKTSMIRGHVALLLWSEIPWHFQALTKKCFLCVALKREKMDFLLA